MPYSVDAERSLVRLLTGKYGYQVMRSGASGGGTKIVRPDLLAGSSRYKRIFAIEVKTSHKTRYSIPVAQLDALIYYAAGFHVSCIPLLAVWMFSPGTMKKSWRCIRADIFLRQKQQQQKQQQQKQQPKQSSDNMPIASAARKTVILKSEEVYGPDWNDLVDTIQALRKIILPI